MIDKYGIQKMLTQPVAEFDSWMIKRLIDGLTSFHGNTLKQFSAEIYYLEPGRFDADGNPIKIYWDKDREKPDANKLNYLLRNPEKMTAEDRAAILRTALVWDLSEGTDLITWALRLILGIPKEKAVQLMMKLTAVSLVAASFLSY